MKRRGRRGEGSEGDWMIQAFHCNWQSAGRASRTSSSEVLTDMPAIQAHVRSYATCVEHCQGTSCSLQVGNEITTQVHASVVILLS